MHSCVARARVPAVSYLTVSNVRCSTVRLGVGHASGKHCQACADTLLFKQACRAAEASGANWWVPPLYKWGTKGLLARINPAGQLATGEMEGEREVWRRGSLPLFLYLQDTFSVNIAWQERTTSSLVPIYYHHKGSSFSYLQRGCNSILILMLCRRLMWTIMLKVMMI